MAEHNILGKEGEEMAAKYLENKGYTILDRDWHCGHKDLDLVVTKDDMVVFVEPMLSLLCHFILLIIPPAEKTPVLYVPT